MLAIGAKRFDAAASRNGMLILDELE